MIEVLKKHIDQALHEYSEGEKYQGLLSARKKYFDVTGIINEDDEDYESRMSSFNEWFVFQYRDGEWPVTVMEQYMEKENLAPKIVEAFKQFNHSLFEFTGKSFRGNLILKDLLHENKIVLAKDHPPLSMLKSDLFLGRTLTYEGETYLMSGICMLPSEAKSALKKEAKKIYKMGEPFKEIEFLLHADALKNKWRRYAHIDASKIFTF